MATQKPRQTPTPLQWDCHELIADMQRAVVDIWPDSTQQQIDHVAAQIRERWGGDRPPYLAGDGRRKRRDADIRRLHLLGERIPYLARKFELTPRQIARIVSSNPAID